MLGGAPLVRESGLQTGRKEFLRMMAAATLLARSGKAAAQQAQSPANEGAKQFAERVLEDCGAAFRCALCNIGDRLGIRQTTSRTGREIRRTSCRADVHRRHVSVAGARGRRRSQGGGCVPEWQARHYVRFLRGPVSRHGARVRSWIPASTCAAVDSVVDGHRRSFTLGRECGGCWMRDRACVDCARKSISESALCWIRSLCVADRLQFVIADSSKLQPGKFDLVTIFNSVHHFSEPVALLTHCRKALKAGRVCFIIDANLSLNPEDNMNIAVRVSYPATTLWCLQDSMAGNGAGLGSEFGEAVLKDLGSKSGFTQCRKLAGSTPLEAYYELRS